MQNKRRANPDPRPALPLSSIKGAQAKANEAQAQAGDGWADPEKVLPSAAAKFRKLGLFLAGCLLACEEPAFEQELRPSDEGSQNGCLGEEVEEQESYTLKRRKTGWMEKFTTKVGWIEGGKLGGWKFTRKETG